MKFWIILFILIGYFNCTQKKSDDKLKDLAKYIANGSSTAAVTPTFACTGTTKFSDLLVNGTYSRCQSCHNNVSASANANFDGTYASAKSRVTIGNPSTSLLYLKITTGTMASNSDTVLANTVYCWILGGALQ